MKNPVYSTSGKVPDSSSLTKLKTLGYHDITEKKGEFSYGRTKGEVWILPDTSIIATTSLNYEEWCRILTSIRGPREWERLEPLKDTEGNFIGPDLALKHTIGNAVSEKSLYASYIAAILAYESLIHVINPEQKSKEPVHTRSNI